jgi:hypothetical protein
VPASSSSAAATKGLDLTHSIQKTKPITKQQTNSAKNTVFTIPQKIPKDGSQQVHLGVEELCVA